jgi:hypothetical protein
VRDPKLKSMDSDLRPYIGGFRRRRNTGRTGGVVCRIDFRISGCWRTAREGVYTIAAFKVRIIPGTKIRGSVKYNILSGLLGEPFCASSSPSTNADDERQHVVVSRQTSNTSRFIWRELITGLEANCSLVNLRPCAVYCNGCAVLFDGRQVSCNDFDV